MKSAKLLPRASKGKLIASSFLFALFFTILLYFAIRTVGEGNNAPAVLSIGFFWVWALFSIILIRRSAKITINKSNALCDTAVVQEIQHTKKEDKQGREIVRTEIYPVQLSLSAYLQDKGANRNVAISGMARSGKTFLLYWLLQELREFKTEWGDRIPLHRVVFQAKASDRFKELGIPTLFINHFVPDVFKDPDSFVMAWRVAFNLTMRGITAVRIEPMLLQIVKSIQDKPSWEAFKNKLDEMLNEEKRNISAEALGTIQSVFRSIAVEDNTDDYRKMANIELPQDIVVDFEGVNNLAFAFYGEFLLRQLDNDIESGKREGTSIMIDEAHLFNREDSIIPRISAVISSRGSLIVATQQLSSISGQIKGNCGTQFTFRQTERDDLNEASALSEVYHWIVQRLHPYEFIDLAQSDSHRGVTVMHIFNPIIEWQPIQEWIPQGQVMRGGQDERQDKEGIDYQKAIFEVLTEAGNIQDLGKRLAEKYTGEAERHRLKIKNLLPKMALNEKIGMEVIDYVKFVNDKPFIVKSSKVYFRRGEIPSGLHSYLAKSTADVLFHRGQIPRIMPVGIGTADIETDKVVYEIESGLKNDISDLKSRIARYHKEGKDTIIIVPNESTKDKYTREYPQTKIYTIPELWRERSEEGTTPVRAISEKGGDK